MRTRLVELNSISIFLPVLMCFQDLQSNSRPFVILTELPTELLIKIFTYITEKNCFKNLSQTCQRFNELCAVDFTLRLNFECITKVELPIINRDYSKVIMEGTEIPEHLLDLLSSLNFETVSSLKITRAHTCKNKKSSGKGNNHCRIHARTYLKILKMFPNIKILELDAVRLSVILKSDIIDVDDLPDLQNLTFLKVRDVNESVYQCLWKATNLTKIDAKKITEATRGCRNFMNLLEQCRTNLKHLEADTFDMSKRFSMDALEYLYFDFSLRYSCLFDFDENFNFWLFDSPILKTCTIKIFDIQVIEFK